MAIVCTNPDTRQKACDAFFNKNVAEPDYERLTEYLSNRSKVDEITGIVTMENILEGLLGFQIIDEKDAIKGAMFRESANQSSGILMRQDSFRENQHQVMENDDDYERIAGSNYD